MKNLTYTLLFGTVLLFVTSCQEEFLSETPYSFIGPENFYNNPDELEMATNSVYLYRDGSYYTRHYMTYLSGLVGPALTNRDGSSNSKNQWDWWNYKSTSSELGQMWPILYRGVNWANAVITNGAAMEDNQESPAGYNKVDRVIAEARFHRALIYLYMTDYWGDIPLRTEEVVGLDSLAIGRTPIEEIQQVMIDDLLFAEAHLPEWTEYSSKDIGRVCKAAAQALLAKVYLTTEQYSEANSYCDKIINKGIHGLAPNYKDLWFMHNPTGSENYSALNYEILYDNQHSRSVGSFGGQVSRFLAPRNSGLAKNQFTTYAGEYWFIKSFEEGDDRLEGNFLMEYSILTDYEGHSAGETVRYDVDNILTDGYAEDGPAIIKFLDPDPTYDQREEPNYPVLRYSDVLLMKAEALDKLGQNSTAIEYVNMVRRRAFGLDPKSPAPDIDWSVGSVDNFRKELYIERLKELCLESWGFSDLKRFWDVATPIIEMSSRMEIIQKDVDGKDVKVLNANPKGVVNSTDKFKLFPLPTTIMESNPALTPQNPGWDNL